MLSTRRRSYQRTSVDPPPARAPVPPPLPLPLSGVPALPAVSHSVTVMQPAPVTAAGPPPSASASFSMPTEVLLKPLLTSLQAVAVRDFLEAVRKYHRHNARYGLPRVDLDALIAPALLPAIKGWVETQGINIPHDPGEGSAAGTGAGAGAGASASASAGQEETKSADSATSDPKSFTAHPQAAAWDTIGT